MPEGPDADATLTGGESLAEGRDADRTPVDPVLVELAAPEVDPVWPGLVIAGRYRLVERLGEGGHGEVWTADDLVLREPVALKWMRFTAGPNLSRVRREITTLRMLRIPGVVRLLDDGVDRGRPFLVMERVAGSPFPGSAAPCPGAPRRFTWAAIADPVQALLEVLARVHAAGVVHRDLKPENILVSADGRPTVLDFGISLWREPGARLTEAGQILGTPLFLAPEQILGDRLVDARTDLYAVGVMLFAALTGRPPHEAAEVQPMLRARLMVPAPPTHELAPGVPAAVAQAIDRLLATRIEDRFRSATEALAALRGERAALRAGPELPRLGGDRVPSAVIGAARAGRSIDVVGAPGTGRSRCLRDAADALEREGLRVAWTRPARAPLASLQPIVGALGEHASLRLDEITARVDGALRAALAEGTVVIADDAERLDAWSAAALERCRGGPGAIVRALSAAPPGARPEEVARLEALDEVALRPLFAGPDRLFHLREDGARTLWERTEGVPARIEAEVALWVRLGLARWDGAALAIERDALSRLSAGLPGAAPAHATQAELTAEPHLEELLQWLALGGHHLDIDQLARVTGQPAWKLEAERGELVSRGAARLLPGERAAPRGQVDITWPMTRRKEAHRAIAAALRPGQEGRLFHLIEAELASEVGGEAVMAARRHARAGDLGAATGALGEGLSAARQQGDARGETRLLEEWVKVAFAEATPRAMDRALYELSRAIARGPEVARLDALLRAGLAAPGASGARALEQAEGLPPFEDLELERWRQRARVVAAATRSSPDLLEEVLADVGAWAAESGEPLAELSLAEGEARLRYVEGRFEEAAALHARAAELEPWPIGKTAATLNAGSALLEAFRLREAAERAAVARDLAAECRHAHLEGRAEWLLRAVENRRGRAAAPDLELVEAAACVGVPELEALVDLNEAAVAFHAGEPDVAAELSGRAADLWRLMDRPWAALLARCLALASGAPAQEGELEALSERARACRVPGIGVQALGLLGRASREPRPGWREAAEELAREIPREHWGRRIDVLSVDEALEGVAGAAISGAARPPRDPLPDRPRPSG